MELEGQQLRLNCPQCSCPPDQNMITCSKCQKEYHILCTNATADQISALSYKCKTCITPRAESIRTTSSRTSKKSEDRRVQLKLQQLEEERAVSMKFISKKYKIINQHEQDSQSDLSSLKSSSVSNWLKEVPNPEVSVEKVHSGPKSAPENNNTNKTLEAALPLPNESVYLSMPPYVENTNNDNSCGLYNIPHHYKRLNAPPISSCTATTTLSAPVGWSSSAAPCGFQQQQQAYRQSVTFVPPVASNTVPTFTNPPTIVDGNSTYLRQSLPNPIGHSTEHTNNLPRISNTTNNFSSNLPHNLFANSNFCNPRLNQGQLQARHSLPKELPIFSGQPEEWPLFSSTFEWSTKICGFTDPENLIRLQKSLRGDALQKVQHILVHPSNVNWVMSILKLLYGQPEKIVNSIKSRIKQTPPVDENDLSSFTSFAINVKSLIATIEASNLNNELNNSSLLQELIQKLPPCYQLQWGSQKLQLLNQNKSPNMCEFSNWIFNIGISATCITVDNTLNHKREKSHTTSNNSKKAYIHTHTEDRKCFVCNNNKCKTISNCQKYISLNRSEKWNIVRKHKLCRICLCKHYGECKKKTQCGVEGCQYYHHSSLHRYSQETNNNTSSENNTQVSNDVEVINTHNIKEMQVLFKIIPITVYGKNKRVQTYAFIDEGSSISLVDNKLIEVLELHGETNPLCLKWTGGIERCENNSQKLTIHISGGNNKRVPINVRTVSKINLPSQSLDYKNLAQRFKHLKNLPVESYFNAEPTILIGLNHFNLGISKRVRHGGPHEPVAICTNIGWMIYGAIAENTEPSKNFNFHICECSKNEERLEELVKSFYSLDSVGIGCKDPLVGKEDVRAVSLLKQHTKQRVDRHYEVPLLWKCDILNLPNSYEMAFRRLLCLERKLKGNSDLLKIFQNTIEKYMSKGYIRKLKREELNNHGKVWYLPIFAVFNKNKPGKSRVVWDAAAKSNGVSLNSFLLKGPDMLASLPAILFSFRLKKIAFCGDIEEMFHQIFIRPEDRDVQRFLWRDCNQDNTPEVYVMDVMIFGASCAPSISQYIKNLNAAKFQQKYPQAAKSIIENHYVDDLLESVDTTQEAISLLKDIKFIHKRGGFNIRNFVSNSEEVMKTFSGCCSNNKKCLNINEAHSIEKVLGVFWEPQEDVITFKIAPWLIESEIFSSRKIPTKREMLRLVMSIYDPLGLIGNIIMYVKILLQEVWRSKINWDEEISAELMNKWSQWVDVLPCIQHIKIQRCYLQYLPSYDGVKIQLHTFVDASRDGYAAVSYFRFLKNEMIVCSLAGSKTRVAPIKVTSVPRLELMAALIGARFAKFICDNHKVVIEKRFFWSDSKTVLSWINSNHRKYNQFVAFRVTEILEISSINDWRWISTKQNVADEATKWTRIPNVDNTSRWFQGPDFLHKPQDTWPDDQIFKENTTEEMLHESFQIALKVNVVNVQRFSRWSRLLRATAYAFRFIENCKTKKILKGELTREELSKAESFLVRQAQSEKYAIEIACIKSKTKVLKSSELYTKTPFRDEQGVLRVDGRIDNAMVPIEQKRPIILPRSSYITYLIILHYHSKYYHINHETVINEIRQKYCISKLRAVFKSVTRNCQWCKIKKAAPQVPQMAKLPRARLAVYEAPFTFTGLDFFGPILVTVNRHKEKRYGCLFTCLTVRAIHIEIAHSLTTNSCILAIRNFMARRGIPRELFSDNGTNFIGAERELREALLDVDQDQFVKAFTTSTTKWNFNPPASPHMGGAWERLVRSVKTVLYNIMTSRAPSDELLISMMMEVENIINSRPLAYVPVDNETEEAVTPNHFLLGSSSGLKPLSTCNDSGIVLKQNWLISQQYANIFWKKWLAEYLPSLTCRSKWFEKQKALCQGDLVIIVDPSLPRNVWLRGKVQQTRLAKDGQVRSAKVLTSSGILERPVAKLAVLDVASRKEYADEDTSCHTGGEDVAATGKNS